TPKRKVIDGESQQPSGRQKRSRTTLSENGDLSPGRRRSSRLQKRSQSEPLPKRCKMKPRNVQVAKINIRNLVQTRNRRASQDDQNRAKPQVQAKGRRLSQPAEATEQDFVLHYTRIPVTTLRFWYRARFHEEAPETRDQLVNRLAQDDIFRNRN